MDMELFSKLETKVGELLAAYTKLKHENLRLSEENSRLVEERNSVKNSIDAILEKLEGIKTR